MKKVKQLPNYWWQIEMSIENIIKEFSINFSIQKTDLRINMLTEYEWQVNY